MEEFTLVRDFAIIMAVAGVAILIFRRLNQPPILGYLIAGLIVGPFTLPLLGVRAPVTNIGSIRLLADLGLILLLFALGMEFGWQRIRQMGVRVVLMGAIEMTFMVALGYEIGTLLGWSGTEAIFLGAALSISSSAILVKMLRDTGNLFRPHGRLIVGILVVEDFAAVLLLSVLSGVATTGTASLGDIGSLLIKLGLFLVSALALGALFAPRLIDFVAKFKSRETILIVSLALCFGLALVAEELGISAAAGAFIIGTVLGDTEHSEDIIHTMEPIRDIFAALFFVSIGMLIDISLITTFIVPALIVSIVFIGGKVFIDTVATFIAGHDERTSLRVGMGMPQIGEFSLAMIKVGADHNAVGTFLYPVVAVATAFTSLVYPFIFRSADTVASFIERRSPRIFKDYFGSLSDLLMSIRTIFVIRGELTNRVQRQLRVVLVNLGIIVVLITIGTFLLGFISELSHSIKLPQSILGLVLSGIVVVLSVPSAVFIWRALQSMTDLVSQAILRRGDASLMLWGRADIRHILRDSILIVIVVLIVIWSLPFISRLMALGGFSTPIPIALLIAAVAIAWRIVFKLHQTMETAFAQTFLGEDAPSGQNVAESNSPLGETKDSLISEEPSREKSDDGG